MLIIPYKADLDLNPTPVVTYVVIALCFIIFFLQLNSRAEVNDSVYSYCRTINQENKKHDPLDVLPQSIGQCAAILSQLNTMQGTERIRQAVIKANLKQARYSEQETIQYLDYLQARYDEYRLFAPVGLDTRLMYYPDTFNPLRSITSALSHPGWLHIIGNIIFFLAFAPAVEALVGSAVRFVLIMLGVAFCCDMTYSLVSLSSEVAIPSLGLSGVVSGLIGMSAFIMPRARIRTFIWVIIVFWRISIPAWILAVWFIGWDAYTVFSAGGNTGGVNLIAHVSGGVAGYIIGYIWFKDQRDEIAEELAAEINFSKARNSDKIGGAIQSKAIQQMDEADQSRRLKREQNEFFDKIYNLVRTEQDSEAINLIIADYDLHHPSIEIYTDWFTRVGEWRQGRTYLCIGRLVIQLLVDNHRLAPAVLIAEKCLAVTKNFVLAEPRHVLLLAHEAISQHHYQVAYGLLRETEKRYLRSVEPVRCGFLEVDVLTQHLQKPAVATQRIQSLLPIATPAEREVLLDLAKHIPQPAS